VRIRELLNYGAEKLSEISETPRLDSSILLSECLDYDRAKILANYEEIVSDETITHYKSMVNKRSEGYPVAYILGEKEFYGYNFYIEDGVLIPRPDTEILVETALDIIKKYSLKTVLDLCTGTGCIAITIKKENPNTEVTAGDISPVSQKVFTINNRNLANNSVIFVKTDLFSSFKNKKFDIIVTNPPYLTTDETDERVEDGWKEPTLALDGGRDGLDLIKKIIKQAPEYLNTNGWLIIEAGDSQMDEMKILMIERGYKDLYISKDLAGLDRIIVGRYE